MNFRTSSAGRRAGLWLLIALGCFALGCGDDDGGTDSGGSGGTATGSGGDVNTGGQGAHTGGAEVGGGGSGATGGDGGSGGDGGTEPSCVPLDQAIDQDGLLAHLEALEQIAADNDGNRAAGSAGWDASVAYVTEQLEAAGYQVTSQAIEHPFFHMLADPGLVRTAPSSHTYLVSADGSDPAADFQNVNFSPPGDVTANVEAVDLALGAGNSSTSGCEAADFASFTSGSIALLQRGTCPFQVKALNAEAAGASAVILFNQGNTPEREGLMPGGVTILGGDADHGIGIPVIFATYGVGEELATLLQNGTATLHLTVDTVWEVRITDNLFAETASGLDDEVVMLGGHLDSVVDGPGINDNGTGVAALLGIARVIAPCDVTRKARFAFWAAEEFGQWGSGTYVFGPSAPDPATIHSYLNADVLGSPNPVHFIYDGDGSVFGAEGPPGSAEIELFFQADFLFAGLPHDAIFSDLSDHFPFFLAGVAYGGLFTGVGDHKTAEQAAVFGGTADAPYDPCNHASCDTVSNVDMVELEAMTKSLARAAQFFAVDGSSVPPQI